MDSQGHAPATLLLRKNLGTHCTEGYVDLGLFTIATVNSANILKSLKMIL